jgi:hypothetical protein
VLLVTNNVQRAEQRKPGAQCRAQLTRHRQNIFARNPVSAEPQKTGKLRHLLKTGPLGRRLDLFSKLRHKMTFIGQTRNRTPAVRRLDSARDMLARLIYRLVRKMSHN